MRLTINLATRPYYDRRTTTVLLLALILLSVLGLLLGTARLSRSTHELRRLADDIAKQDARTAAQQSATRDPATDRQQKRAAALAKLTSRQAAANWLGLLNDLESVVPLGISLTKLEPDGKGELTLEGSTRTFGELQRLLEQLERSGRFSDPVLVSHTNRQDAELGRMVQFVIKSRIVAP